MGCYACMIACKQENDLPSLKDAVPGTMGFSFIRVESTGPAGEYPDLSGFYYEPIPCMHCAEPPCIPACPTEAIYKRDSDGIVLIDEDACTGCEVCLAACPYGAIYMDAERDIARKCTFCVDLADQGKVPACVDACNGGAIFFGDIHDPASNIYQVLKKNKDHSYCLKQELQTKPSVHYLKIPN